MVIAKKYSNYFLISELKRYFNTYKKIPTVKKYDKNTDYPGATVYSSRFGSWNKALKLAELEVNNNGMDCIKDYNGIKNDYLNGMSLNAIAKKYNYNADSAICGVIKKLNIIKRNNRWTKQQIQILKEKYSCEKWDVLVELLKLFSKEDIIHKAYKLGLKREIYFWSDEELQILNDYYENTSPKKLKELLPNRTYGSIVCKAGELNLKYREWWSNEEIEKLIELYPVQSLDNLIDTFDRSRNSLICMAAKVGLKDIFHWKKEEDDFIVKYNNILTDEEMCDYLIYRNIYSIRERKNNLNLQNSNGVDKTELIWNNKEIDFLHKNYNIKLIINICEELNKNYYDVLFMIRKLGLSVINNHNENQKEILLNKLKEFALELERTPFSYDITNCKDMPGILSYHRYFGSYTEACRLAGLELNYNIYGEKINVLYSKNNDICYSNGELLITNYMIDNNIEYEKEKLYKYVINDIQCGEKRTDWVVNNNIIVEYFGMPEKDFYRKKMNVKIKLCKNNNVLLIDIYEKDLSYNLKGVKEKLSIINN